MYDNFNKLIDDFFDKLHHNDTSCSFCGGGHSQHACPDLADEYVRPLKRCLDHDVREPCMICQLERKLGKKVT